MRSNGPLANKKVAMGGHGWPGGLVASFGQAIPPDWPKVAVWSAAPIVVNGGDKMCQMAARYCTSRVERKGL